MAPSNLRFTWYGAASSTDSVGTAAEVIALCQVSNAIIVLVSFNSLGQIDSSHAHKRPPEATVPAQRHLTRQSVIVSSVR